LYALRFAYNAATDDEGLGMSEEPNTLSRREFTALSLAAGALAATGAAAASVAPLVDADVQLAMSTGTCDAALIYPQKGAWPGVILYTDVFGLRPTMRDMAKRLAADGYTVLVPNPFYRSTKPPGVSTEIDFNNPADRAKIDALRAPLSRDAVMQDTRAYVRFLDAQPAVNKKAKMGVFGYCMGGPMTLQAAAASPERIGAGASFHGGGLVTDKPDSPHLLIATIKAQYYVGIAMNDDQRQPGAKNTLDAAFKAADLPAKIEVYDGCLHGWCVDDMPNTADTPAIYNEAQAERAWGELVSLYRRAHV
jgi:carboxymethylenebutenolidase